VSQVRTTVELAGNQVLTLFHDEAVDQPPPIFPALKWENIQPGKVLCVRVVLGPLEEEEISVHVPSLPGVASQGRSEPECVENIKEALSAAIQEYRSHGEPIPWQQDPGPTQPAETSKWVWLDVE
jgi:predicted RNase H-like HicB family nuclease